MTHMGDFLTTSSTCKKPKPKIKEHPSVVGGRSPFVVLQEATSTKQHTVEEATFALDLYHPYCKTIKTAVMNRATAYLFVTSVIVSTVAWLPDLHSSRPSSLALPASRVAGSVHGQNSCFLPLKQLDQDYYSPRIVQVRHEKGL